jgi:phage baseplate assembly protein W
MATPINIKFPMRTSPKGAFDTNEDTLSAVADDLKILILTNHGERPIHYDFGANLRALLFEQQTSDFKQRVGDQIRSAVEKWMPFVNILRLDVQDSTTSTSLKTNEVHVEIEFSVGNIDARKVLKQRIRG